MGVGGASDGVGGVLAASGGAGELAGAVGAVSGPHGADSWSDAGLWALQAGFVQDQRALVGVDGADDAVDPLRVRSAWRLVAVSGDHGGEGDLAKWGHAPTAAVVDRADPGGARWRRADSDLQPGMNRHCVAVACDR